MPSPGCLHRLVHQTSTHQGGPRAPAVRRELEGLHVSPSGGAYLAVHGCFWCTVSEGIFYAQVSGNVPGPGRRFPVVLCPGKVDEESRPHRDAPTETLSTVREEVAVVPSGGSASVLALGLPSPCPRLVCPSQTGSAGTFCVDPGVWPVEGLGSGCCWAWQTRQGCDSLLERL